MDHDTCLCEDSTYWRDRAEAAEKKKRDVAEDVWELNAECNLRQKEIERQRAQALSMTVFAQQQVARIEAALSVLTSQHTRDEAPWIVGEAVKALKEE